MHALINDHPVPFIWLTEHTHPPTELRIDKLRKTSHTETHAVVQADERQPVQQTASR